MDWRLNYLYLYISYDWLYQIPIWRVWCQLCIITVYTILRYTWLYCQKEISLYSVNTNIITRFCNMTGFYNYQELLTIREHLDSGVWWSSVSHLCRFLCCVVFLCLFCFCFVFVFMFCLYGTQCCLYHWFVLIVPFFKRFC